MFTTLEVAATIARSRPSGVIDVQCITEARDGRVLHQGRDEHYDQVSALIKSIRGSDPDAGLYWLIRLLEAGESPRFLARRLVILASEDIGMADPMSLVVAEAGARAVELIGIPEARLTLAQMVLQLATAPKSNSVTTALASATSDVVSGPMAQVPAHLRDGHYRGAEALGHGVGYQYPHDSEEGWVAQQYLPDELKGRRYYMPSKHGREFGVLGWLNHAMGGQDPTESGVEEAPR